MGWRAQRAAELQDKLKDLGPDDAEVTEIPAELQKKLGTEPNGMTNGELRKKAEKWLR